MDFKALDVLSADVDDKLNVGHKVLCGGEVSDGLNNAVVHVKGVFDDVLAVAGDRGRNNIDIGIYRVDFLEESLDNLDGIAL